MDDPLKFSHWLWPSMKFYSKQEDILYSLRDNKETYVHSANEMGKDFTLSVACLWWFFSRVPARVITTSSGEVQLKNILWSEIKQRIADAVHPLNIQVNFLEIKRRQTNGELFPLCYIIGHVTNVVENFQGHHLDHDIPRVLAAFDEASSIEDPYYHAAASWAHKIIVVGNPLSNTNWFYRHCKKGDLEDPAKESKLFRKIIHIDGLDSPNVQMGMALAKAGIPGPYPNVIPGVMSYAEYVQKDAEMDVQNKTTRLHGRFYEGEENMLYPPAWLDLAEKRFFELELNKIKRKAKAMGVDGAEGRDLTCFTIIDELGIIIQITIPTPDTSRIAKLTIQYMQEYGIPASKVLFDAGGGGKQIADQMRAGMGGKRYDVRSVSFGGRPTPDRAPKTRDKKIDAKETGLIYKNRRAEMYGMLRKQMNPSINPQSFAIPNAYDKLREELAILPLLYDEEGKMFLPPKDRKPTAKKETAIVTLREMLGRSPDRADGLVLANFALHSKSTIVLGAL